jgi:hypothetical protein
LASTVFMVQQFREKGAAHARARHNTNKRNDLWGL